LDKKYARKLLNLPLNKKIILSVGASYTKGFDTLVELARRQKDMLFLVVSQSGTQRIPQNMQIRSWVPNSQMPIFYSAADCFTFPSKFEGCSIAPLEAMACNLPIVSSETGAFFKMAYDQPFGHVLPLYCTERDYEKAMLDVINESNLNPRAFVERHFSLEIFIEKYRNLLKKVLSN
jgi:glycosyltransferase involved in cell wall biosynthesis